MDVNTYDQFIYDSAVSAGGVSEQSPFVQKILLSVPDINPSSNYTNNIITFDGNSLANNGKYLDWKNAYLSIPLVIQLNGTTAVDFTALTADFAVWLKNSTLNLIHNVQVDIGNRTVVQKVDNINQYLLFKLNTEMTEEMEDMHPELAYRKDTSSSWSYSPATASSSIGQGLCNNAMGYDTAVQKMGCSAEGSIFNDGMADRAKDAFVAGGSTLYGKHYVLGDSTKIDAMYKNTGKNIVVNTNNCKYIYYTAIIPLRHLPLFNSPEFPPLLKSAYVKITMTVNQGFITFTKDSNGNLTYNQASSQYGGGTCPLLVSSSYKTVTQVSGTLATGITSSSVYYPSGSSPLPLNQTYQASLSICQTRYNHAQGAVTKHPQATPLLNINAYVLSPEKEKAYLSLGQKSIKYTTLTCVQCYNVINQFNIIVSPGVARAKRLILCPYLASSGNCNESNAGFSELVSPFSTAPSTTAPYQITNFNCLLGMVPVYPSPLNYNYQEFLSEMSEHEALDMVGRININDFNNLHQYYVIDLRRRLPVDYQTLQSITIQGSVISSKAIDIYAWIEAEDTIALDLATGIALA